MKKFILITVLILISSIWGIGQTKLDSVLFNKVNEYRHSMGLCELVWDTCGYKAVDHHTLYLICNNFNSPSVYLKAVKESGLGTSTIIIPGFHDPHGEPNDTFARPINRYKYYCGKGNGSVGEVISGTNNNIKDGDSTVYDKIVTKIIECWKDSPVHNKILLDKDARHGACSVGMVIMTQMKGWKTYFITSTFIVI
jgi:hypothetical protein